MPSDEKNEKVLTPTGDDVIKATELIDLERSRIRAQDRRNDVMLAAIQASDVADKSQYDYHSEREQNRSALAEKRHATLVKVVWFILSVGLLITVGLLSFVFLGDTDQSQNAITFLKNLGVALSGAGTLIVGRSIILWIKPSD